MSRPSNPDKPGLQALLYPSDNEQGLTLGQSVASLVIQRANRDGAG